MEFISLICDITPKSMRHTCSYESQNTNIFDIVKIDPRLMSRQLLPITKIIIVPSVLMWSIQIKISHTSLNDSRTWFISYERPHPLVSLLLLWDVWNVQVWQLDPKKGSTTLIILHYIIWYYIVWYNSVLYCIPLLLCTTG